jgi:hypothetical protein
MAYFSMMELAITFLVSFQAQYGLLQYDGIRHHIPDFISGTIWFISVRRKSPSYSKLNFRQNVAYFSTTKVAITFLTSFQAPYDLFQYDGNSRHILNLISGKIWLISVRGKSPSRS